jgi:hypothetical protein
MTEKRKSCKVVCDETRDLVKSEVKSARRDKKTGLCVCDFKGKEEV